MGNYNKSMTIASLIVLLLIVSSVVACVHTSQEKENTVKVYVDLDSGTFDSGTPDGWTLEYSTVLGNDVIWKEYKPGTSVAEIVEELYDSSARPVAPEASFVMYRGMSGADVVTEDGIYIEVVWEGS